MRKCWLETRGDSRKDNQEKKDEKYECSVMHRQAKSISIEQRAQVIATGNASVSEFENIRRV